MSVGSLGVAPHAKKPEVAPRPGVGAVVLQQHPDSEHGERSE
jgi:hypothetical protein